MARPGPARKDPELEKLQGNPGKRNRKDAPMKAPIGAPSCPEWLHKYGKEEWRRVVPLLIQVGAISRLDRVILVKYCDLYGRYRLMCERIDRMEEDVPGAGYTTSNGAGGETVSPYVKNQQKYAEMLKSCIEKLGLSPADRAKVLLPKLNVVDNKDEDDELFD